MKRRRRTPHSVILPARWRRYMWRLVAAGVAAVALAWYRVQPEVSDAVPGSDWTRYHDKSFLAVRVVDGDTLDIDVPDGKKPTTRIRLWGVDAPEIRHGGEPAMYFGPEAGEFAERLLEGQNVHIVLSSRRTRDKYNRLLAYVHLERAGPIFNETLVEEGYAYADRRFPHEFKRQFEAAEQRARRGKAGLWSGITQEQMPKWKQDKSERFDGVDQNNRFESNSMQTGPSLIE